MNLREYILNSDDLPKRTMTIPQWGGIEIAVRAMTLAERMAFVKRFEIHGADAYAGVVCACVTDPATGAPLFLPADSRLLAGKSGKALEDIFSAIAELSNFLPSAIEDAEKNLPVPEAGS